MLFLTYFRINNINEVMKLVTLNLWGGRISDKYKEFFESHLDIDAWFFQEVFKEKNGQPSVMGKQVTEGFKSNRKVFSVLEEHLIGYENEFCQIHRDTYGLASFIKKDFTILDKGEILIAKGNWDEVEDSPDRDMNRKLQWIEVKVEGRKILIANVHFTHRPEGKRDSEKRLKQSKIVVDFLNMFDCPKILVGDFNLLPDTESIKMIEETGMRNLVKEYDIASTRTRFYKKKLRLADYIFVSPEIEVLDFKVLPEEVSDHSPLFLEFK